jgi:hypothetical protein
MPITAFKIQSISICFATLLVLCCSPSFAQQSSMAMKVRVIEGSKTPELIPDSTAYRLVFVGLSEPPDATAAQIARETRKLSRLDLTEGERAVFTAVLADFHTKYTALRGQYKNAPWLSRSQPYKPLREALVADTVAQLEKQLTPTGLARFRTFVKDAKQKMQINYIAK